MPDRRHFRTDLGPTDQPGEDWRTFAACLGHDLELWFATGTTGPALLQIEQAKQVCCRCPVRDACLAWALESGDGGVWGGTTDEERRALKRRRANAAAGVTP